VSHDGALEKYSCEIKVTIAASFHKQENAGALLHVSEKLITPTFSTHYDWQFSEREILV
jgi:hypothetical protein